MDKSATYIVWLSCRSLLSFRLHDTLLIKIADADDGGATTATVYRVKKWSWQNNNAAHRVPSFDVSNTAFPRTFSPLAFSFTHTSISTFFSDAKWRINSFSSVSVSRKCASTWHQIRKTLCAMQFPDIWVIESYAVHKIHTVYSEIMCASHAPHLLPVHSVHSAHILSLFEMNDGPRVSWYYFAHIKRN